MSLFDLAAGRIRTSRPIKSFFTHSGITQIESYIFDELLEGPKSTNYLITKRRISQIGLERLENAGYIKASRSHPKYTGMGSELWMLDERGLDYLGQRMSVVD